MKDPWNPTDDEIAKWAFEHDSLQPTQDWSLAVSYTSRAPLLIRLAADATCPKRQFFLSCLYLLVGDAVRSSGIAHDLAEIQQLLDKAAHSPSKSIARWAARSQELLANPQNFDYQAWCDGGLSCDDTN